MAGNKALEAMAATLEASGQYRVLRKLEWPEESELPADASLLRKAVYVDVETTGFSPSRGDEVIQLAMIPFTYTLDGRVVQVHEPFNELRQPARPIPPEITRLTGITNDDVAGRTIDPEAAAAFAADCQLVIAHNAGFDRPFVEQLIPAFARKHWACSVSDIDWRSAGYESSKLEYLATAAGFFYEKHRAEHDCLAGIRLLSQELPGTDGTALRALRENAMRSHLRIYAEEAPFGAKEALRERRYRWNGGENGRPRAWWREIAENDLEAEMRWLTDNVYEGKRPPVSPQRITALERYSVRAA